MMHLTQTQELAQFITDKDSESISSGLRKLARNAAIDTVGCALAALHEPVVSIVNKSVQDANEGLIASVWGLNRKVSVADAAFLNAVSSHALDFDDNIPTMRGHPSTTMLPCVFATGEALGSSGTEILDAFILGLEVAGKLGLAFGPGHYTRGWHPTSSVGIFGATAATARLFGFNSAQLTHAWGVVASQTSGLIANFGTMAKPFHAGHAARCAIQAVLLVRDGFESNNSIFDEKPRSVFSTYSGDGALPLNQLIPNLSKPWEIQDPGLFVKIWPCCYCSHRPISGLLQLLREHSIKPEEIKEVAIGFPPGTDAGLIKEFPTTGLGGKFSIEYTAAALVIDGAINLESFTELMFNRAEVQKMMHKVRPYPIPDQKRWSSTIGYNDVSIVTNRGSFSMRVDQTPGSPKTPLPDSQIDAKFLDCASSSMTSENAERSLYLLRSLTELADCQPVFDCLKQNKFNVNS
jgi:2-methylcitrate dehydratase PrpD